MNKKDLFIDKGQHGMIYRVPIQIYNLKNNPISYELLLLSIEEPYSKIIYNKLFEFRNNSLLFNSNSSFELLFPESESNIFALNNSYFFNFRILYPQNGNSVIYELYNSSVCGFYSFKNKIDQTNLLKQNSSYFNSNNKQILLFYNQSKMITSFNSDLLNSPNQKIYFFSFDTSYLIYNNILQIFSVLNEIENSMMNNYIIDHKNLFTIENDLNLFYQNMNKITGFLLIFNVLQFIPIFYIKYREFIFYQGNIDEIYQNLNLYGYDESKLQNSEIENFKKNSKFRSYLHFNLIKNEIKILTLFYLLIIIIFSIINKFHIADIGLLLYNWFPIFLIYYFLPLLLTHIFEKKYFIFNKNKHLNLKDISIKINSEKYSLLLIIAMVLVFILLFYTGNFYAKQNSIQTSNFLRFIYESIYPISFEITIILVLIFLYFQVPFQNKIIKISLFFAKIHLKISKSYERFLIFFKKQFSIQHFRIYLLSIFYFFVIGGCMIYETSNNIILEQNQNYIDLNEKIVFDSNSNQQKIFELIQKYNISSFYSYYEFQISFKYRPDINPLKCITLNYTQYNNCNFDRKNKIDLDSQNLYLNKNIFKINSEIQKVDDIYLIAKNFSKTIVLSNENIIFRDTIPGLFVPYYSFPNIDFVCDFNYYLENITNNPISYVYVILTDTLSHSEKINFENDLNSINNTILQRYSMNSILNKNDDTDISIFKFLFDNKIFFIILSLIQLWIALYYLIQDSGDSFNSLISSLNQYGIDIKKMKSNYFYFNIFQIIINNVIFGSLFLFFMNILFVGYYSPKWFIGEYFYSDLYFQIFQKYIIFSCLIFCLIVLFSIKFILKKIFRNRKCLLLPL